MMHCPVCKKDAFRSVVVADGLPAEMCGCCRGHWIVGQSYWDWILASGQRPAKPPAAAAPSDAPEELQTAKLCPACGKFLRRFEVGPPLEFCVDHCATCGGFWLDAHELEALIAHGLHTQLHLIATEEWQNRLAAAKHRQAHEARLLEHLGEADLAELKKVKAWLDTHPRRTELYAYLLDHRG